MRATLRAVAVALLLSPAAAAAQDGSAAAYDAHTVVARVNGTDITLAELISLTAQLPDEYRQIPAPALIQGVINQLVEQQVLADSHEGPLPTHAEALLKNQQRSVVANVVMREIADREITEADIQEAYDAAYGGVEADVEYNAAHILVDSESLAWELKRQLDSGADFASLAKEHSTGPSGPNGGNLGWFVAGMMVEPFQAAVDLLAVGEVSDPVQTQYGWHVILLLDKRQPVPPPLEDVRADLYDRILSQRLQDGIQSRRDAATIEMMEMSFPPEAIFQTDLINE